MCEEAACETRGSGSKAIVTEGATALPVVSESNQNGRLRTDFTGFKTTINDAARKNRIVKTGLPQSTE